MLKKIKPTNSWSLKVQLGLFLLLALISMTLIAAKWVVSNEERTLTQSLKERSHHTVVLTTQVMAMAIDDDDLDELETFVTGTILLDKDIVSLTIRDELGDVLYDHDRSDMNESHETISFTEDIIYDNRSFGSMTFMWDLTQFADQLLEETRTARMINDSLLTGISILIFLGSQFLVINPLSILEKRIRDFGDESIDTTSLPALTEKRSREWSQLSQSTNQLQAAIMQQEQRETELKQARDSALEASNYKTNLLTNISHELRTPLNGIMGLSELMMTTELDEEQFEYSESILESGNNLLEIITEMLDFSEIESGNLEIDTEVFDLAKHVEEIVEGFKPMAAEKNLPISFQPVADFPQLVESAPTTIEKIVKNLIDNGIRFTESGAVAITLDSKTTDLNQCEITINVVDTGVGIPTDQLELIFGSFTQVDASLTRSHDGNGLGLAISKGMAGALDGEISVTSEEGAGSTFSLVFPATVPPTSENKKSDPKVALV